MHKPLPETLADIVLSSQNPESIKAELVRLWQIETTARAALRGMELKSERAEALRAALES